MSEAATAVATWQQLGDVDAERLVSLTAALTDGLRWEAARGFELTDHVCATIAAHAALLGLRLAPDSYREVSSVIVHATTIEMVGERPLGNGVVAEGPIYLDGEAHHRGPVLLAWDAVVADTAAPWRGRHVVIHEFAHHLDLLDGWVDGTPPFPDDSRRRRWVAICTEAFERLRSQETIGVIDPYGATDPGEFFAVATETFFTRPHELAHHEPALYDVLVDYLGQNPAGR